MGKSPPVVLLTHDIDILSVGELPTFSRTFLGLGYRLLIENFIRLKKGNISFSAYLHSLSCLAILPFIKLTGRADFIKRSTQKMLELEDNYDVRSTWFFITKNRHPGMLDHRRNAPANRQAYYKIGGYADFINDLIGSGHEAGVHSLDAHWNVELGKQELEIMKKITGRNNIGVRSHWLYFNKDYSHECLAKAGFFYDCTVGWNDRIGMPDVGADVNEGDRKLHIIPTNIQDGALYDECYLGLSFEESQAHIVSLLDKLIEEESVITVLWHNNSFDAPRYWGDGYEFIIKYLKDRGCKFMTVSEYIEQKELCKD